jgi:hypothetical protein
MSEEIKRSDVTLPDGERWEPGIVYRAHWEGKQYFAYENKPNTSVYRCRGMAKVCTVRDLTDSKEETK